MYFKATYRPNTKTGKSDWYYRLVESYRNVLEEVRQHTVLRVGFLNEFTGDQIDLIEKGICDRLSGWISIRKCSEPEDNVSRINNALRYK